jgi:hypothetical protein
MYGNPKMAVGFSRVRSRMREEKSTTAFLFALDYPKEKTGNRVHEIPTLLPLSVNAHLIYGIFFEKLYVLHTRIKR